VSDGIRTHDRLDHNQELYQLSYAHRGGLNLAVLLGLSLDLVGRGKEDLARCGRRPCNAETIGGTSEMSLPEPCPSGQL
jgi:hypothetical protein